MKKPGFFSAASRRPRAPARLMKNRPPSGLFRPNGRLLAGNNRRPATAACVLSHPALPLRFQCVRLFRCGHAESTQHVPERPHTTCIYSRFSSARVTPHPALSRHKQRNERTQSETLDGRQASLALSSSLGDRVPAGEKQHEYKL